MERLEEGFEALQADLAGRPGWSTSWGRRRGDCKQVVAGTDDPLARALIVQGLAMAARDCPLEPEERDGDSP